MDFFAHQEQARRQSSLLLGLFAVAVLLIVVSVYLVILLIFQPPPDLLPSVPASPDSPVLTSLEKYWNGELFAWAAGLTVLLVASGSLYKITSLSSGGGAAIAQSLGGVPVSPSTSRPKERQLLNIVEEMSLAAGISPPRLYLVDSPSVNAFAAGNSINSAVVGVTRGCVEKLSRQELQGVIAHEFSHIINGDMVTNLRLVGLLHGILLIAIVGRILLRTASRSGGSRESGKAKLLFFLVGLGLVAIGSIGVFFGRMIKAAVSRQREFLADATAVQYTRDPEGIYGALEKIYSLPEGGRIDEPVAEEVAHLFFADALHKSSFSMLVASITAPLFSTHPPLPVRMKRILPGGRAASTTRSVPPSGRATRHPLPSFLSARLLDTLEVGQLDRAHLDSAKQWVAALPPILEESLRTPAGSSAVLLALLTKHLTPPEKISAHLRLGKIPSTIWQQATALEPSLATLPASAALPLIDLCLPALKELPVSDLKTVHQHLESLAEQPGGEGLLGYMVNAFVRARLADQLPAQRSLGFSHGITAHLTSVRVILSTLARHGHPLTDDLAQEAFAQAMRIFSAALELGDSGVSAHKLEFPPRFFVLLDRLQCDHHRFDQSLFSLRLAPPVFKEALLASCAECVFKDGTITPAEHQLMRAISGVLDCPIPPPILDLTPYPGKKGG